MASDDSDIDTPSEGRYPLRLIAAVLIVAAVGFAPDIPKRGGYSDDLSYSYETRRLGPVQAGLQQLRHQSARPVQALVLQALFGVFDGRWGWIHAAMTALHLIGAALTAMLLWRWTGNRVGAFSGALFFATYPVANDNVFWPICAGHSLTVAFATAALLAADRWARTGRRGALIAAAALYVCACGCVEQAYVAGPLLAAAAWYAGAGTRRTLGALAVFGASALAYLGLQSLWLAGSRVYQFGTGGDVWSRMKHLATWTATAFGPGEGMYDPARLFSDGWARLTSSPLGWALLGIAVVVAIAASWDAGCPRQPRKPASGRRASILAAMGLFFAFASLSVFLVRENAALSHRHLRFPLLGFSIALAAVSAWFDERFGARRFFRPALLAGAIGVAATIANYGESADYVRSWRYQTHVARRMAQCAPRDLPAAAAVSAEGFLSHFGRARTFADDWSLWGLLHVEQPEAFGGWRGPNLVLYGLESLDTARWPEALAFVAREDGTHVRGAVFERMPDGATRETRLPLAEGVPCPTEVLKLDRHRLEPAARFGSAVALTMVESGVRNRESVFETRVILGVAPADGRVAFPLTLELRWVGPEGGSETATFVIEPSPAGRKLGFAAPWPIGAVPAGWTLRVSVRDADGEALPPVANPPARVDVDVLVFTGPGAR